MEQGCEFAMYWRAPQFQLKTLRQPSVVCISVDPGTGVLQGCDLEVRKIMYFWALSSSNIKIITIIIIIFIVIFN